MEEILAKVDEVEGLGEFPLHDELRWHEPSLQLVKALVNAHPQRIMATNESGMMALHVFARNLVNPEILAFLLESYPQAASTPNNFGQLPLHKAAQCRHCDGEALKVLIAAYPDALLAKNKDGCTPLHVALTGLRPSLTVVGSLLREEPKAAKRRCKRAQVPMHKFAGSHFPPEDTEDRLRILELLNESYPQGIRCQDYDGDLPLHLQVRREQASVEFVNALLFIFPEAAICPNGCGSTPQDVALMKGPDRNISVVSALFNYEAIAAKVAELQSLGSNENDQDAEDDEEELLAMLAATGVDIAYHHDEEKHGMEGETKEGLE